MGKKLCRLDKLLVDRKLCESRTQAQEFIRSGTVAVGGIVFTKTAAMVANDANINVEPKGRIWVSRGAHKLLKAFECWQLVAENLLCLDIGASTGGFTEVLLSYGAKKVVSVDVGYGQLAWKLRQDPRVLVLERTNARFLTEEIVGGQADLLVADTSFISLRLLLPVFETLLSSTGNVVALIKPQFEVGKGRTQGGVVRDPNLHKEVLESMCQFIQEQTDFNIVGMTHSPIKGPEGNIEFLLYLTKNSATESPRCFDTQDIVESAHKDLSAHEEGV